MAHLDDHAHSPTPRRQQPFALYAAGGRVYARNVDQKVIDLGELRQDRGTWRYRLDGNQEAGRGFSTAEEALREIGRKLHFLWLDGQFTAVADARDGSAPDLDGVPQLEILLDELKPGEPIVDSTV